MSGTSWERCDKRLPKIHASSCQNHRNFHFRNSTQGVDNWEDEMLHNEPHCILFHSFPVSSHFKVKSKHTLFNPPKHKLTFFFDSPVAALNACACSEGPWPRRSIRSDIWSLFSVTSASTETTCVGCLWTSALPSSLCGSVFCCVVLGPACYVAQAELVFPAILLSQLPCLFFT